MKVKLEDITPDLLIKIDQEKAEEKISDLTLASLRELAAQREEAIVYLEVVEAECQMRAMRAYDLGFKKKDIAEIFNLTTSQINKWIGSKG